jgi:hypothetical protein
MNETLFTIILVVNLKKVISGIYVWGIAVYGSEICTLRKVDQKHLESFERMDCGVSWADLVKIEEALCGFNNNNNKNNNNNNNAEFFVIIRLYRLLCLSISLIFCIMIYFTLSLHNPYRGKYSYFSQNLVRFFCKKILTLLI